MMKRLILLTNLLLMLGLLVPDLYGQVQMGYWTFNNPSNPGLDDSPTTANNLTFGSGAPVVILPANDDVPFASPSGATAGAIHCPDGLQIWTAIPSSGVTDVIGGDAITIESLFRVGDRFGATSIFYLDQVNTGDDPIRIQLDLLNQQILLDFTCLVGTTATSESKTIPLEGQDQLNPEYYLDQNWHHFAFVFNNSPTPEIQLIVDGVSLPIENNAGVVDHSLAGDLNIASANAYRLVLKDASSRDVEFDLDEVALYNFAVDQNCLFDHYMQFHCNTPNPPALNGGIACTNYTPATGWGATTNCGSNGSLAYVPLTDLTLDRNEYPRGIGIFDHHGEERIFFDDPVTQPQVCTSIGSVDPDNVSPLYDQIVSWPVPRFHSENMEKMPKNFPFIGRAQDYGKTPHSTNPVYTGGAGSVNEMVSFMDELAKTYNYVFFLGQSNDSRSGSLAGGYVPGLVEHAKNNPQYERGLLTFWSGVRNNNFGARRPLQTPSIAAQAGAYVNRTDFDMTDRPEYFLYNGNSYIYRNDGAGGNQLRPIPAGGSRSSNHGMPLDHHDADALTMMEQIQVYKTELSAGNGSGHIDRMVENGEVAPSHVLSDPQEQHLIGAGPFGVPSLRAAYLNSPYYGDWRSFIEDKKANMRRNFLLPSLAANPNLHVDWYQVHGDEGLSSGEYYGIAKRANTVHPVTGRRYANSQYYPQRASRWYHAGGFLNGMETIFAGRRNEIEGGDPYFSPFVSAGNDDGTSQFVYYEHLSLRPAQYLGILKVLATMGAEYFNAYSFHAYNVENCVSNFGRRHHGKHHGWQMSTPGYAQAITSRVHDFYLDSELMEGDYTDVHATGDEYRFWGGQSNHLLVARKHTQNDQYMISGAIENLFGNYTQLGSPLEKEIEMQIESGSFIRLNIRRQGSTFIYENDNPNDPVFYQLDRWHQYEHPDYWTDDFRYEAELWDQNVPDGNGNAFARHTVDANGTAITDGDFSDFVTFNSLPSGGGCYADMEDAPVLEYEFTVRKADQADLYVLLNARAKSGSSGSGAYVQIDAEEPYFVGCIGDQVFDDAFYPFFDAQSTNPTATVTGLSLGKHTLRIIPLNDELEVDQFVLATVANLGDYPLKSPTCSPMALSITSTPTCGNLYAFTPSAGLGSCVHYRWDFGDGTTSTESHPSHAYATAGSYTVTLTIHSENGTTVATQVVNPTLVVNATAVPTPRGCADISCHGGSDGEIILTPPGTGSYTYSLTPSVQPWTANLPTSGLTLDNLSAGIYQIGVDDGNGCTVFEIELEEPAPLEISLTAKEYPCGNNISCHGALDGAIDLEVTGGGCGPYTYLWNTSATAGDGLTGLVAGTYSVTVSTAQGCEEVSSITLTEPLPLALSGLVTQPTCAMNNYQGGEIDLTVAGGISCLPSSLSYAWEGPGGFRYPEEDPTQLQAGTYTVTVTDLNGCQGDAQFTIGGSGAVDFTLNKTDIACNGSPGSGEITVSITSSGTFDLFLSQVGLNGTANVPLPGLTSVTGPGTHTFSNLAAALYEVRVIETGGAGRCGKEYTSVDDRQMVTNFQPLNQGCGGNIGGRIWIGVYGGTGHYQYSIDDGITWSNSPIFSGLYTNNYTCKVRDNAGCEATGTISIAYPGINFTTTTTGPDCRGGNSGEIALSGITWSNSNARYKIDGVTVFVSNPTTQLTIGGLTPGPHTLQLLEGSCKSPVRTVTIPGGQLPSITTTPTTCSGSSNGEIIFTSPAGINYTLVSGPSSSGPFPRSQNTNTFFGLDPGVYEVEVEVLAGCFTLVQTIFLPSEQGFTVEVIDDQCEISPVGEIMVVVNNPTSTQEYSINGGGNWSTSNIFTGLAVGSMHSVQTRTSSAATCLSHIQEVQMGPEPVSIDLATSHETCSGVGDGQILVTANGGGGGGYMYALNGSPWQTHHVFNDLEPGSYTVEVRDWNGCVTSMAVTINAPSAINFSVNPTHPSCFGYSDGELLASSPTGGTPPYTYSLNGYSFVSSGPFENLAPGTYDVFVRDAVGCIVQESETLVAPTQVQANFVARGPCQLPGTGTIAVIPIGVGTNTHQYQLGNNTQVAGNQPDGSHEFTGLLPGTYHVKVQENGCNSLIETVVVPTHPMALCKDATVQLSSQGAGSLLPADVDNNSLGVCVGGSLSVSPNTFTCADLGTQVVTLTVTDGSGNVSNCNANVTVVSDLVADAGDDQAVCQFAPLTLNGSAIGGSGTYTYQWTNLNSTTHYLSDPTLANPSCTSPLSTEYELVVTDGNGCTASDEVSVTIWEDCCNLDCPPTGANLVTEGDFPNTPCLPLAVQSDRPCADPSTFLTSPNGNGSYVIQSDASTWGPAGVSLLGADHTGWNNFLITRSGTTLNDMKLWSEQIAVQKQDYLMSFWVKYLDPNGLPYIKVGLEIGGQTLLESEVVNYSDGWINLCAVYKSEETQTISVDIISYGKAQEQYIGLDDIWFGEAQGGGCKNAGSAASGGSGEEESTTEPLVEVWPNPATEQFHVDVAVDAPTEVWMRLWNGRGKAVFQTQAQMVEGRETQVIPLDKLSSGVYLLEVYIQGKKQTFSLVKQ